ncbi:MAG: methyltransferase domain-containing protein [Gammaproteobacteria bacterium]|nr:methyltransferase domain-containing protein [Gammaproteobacteria bacterium]NIN39615.1 methyltransferase domain-containing protein [Gammaproteobacteria bacterium]NIO25172.1 methyltransferase domain-containing protein [Gammaproteobacteria bacterium]NIO65801.1 methyltransferase domain-containing protein [Gammaproteobacteria bacterium]NIP45761.1 methyltransferase domain-containing protein [Gammaproteobacteria bacterium]
MNGGEKGFLDRAYGLEDAESTKGFYKEWAATYEAETRANGYITPTRCAVALSHLVTDKSTPLLDLGCGTGLSGEAFRDVGFTTIDGSDFSREMLAYAKTKQGVYRELILGDLNDPLPGAPGEYANIAAVGVFSPGHAPPEMIDEVMSKLPAGGCFVFSLNDHALEIPGYEQHIDGLVGAREAELAFREYGDHLPKREIKAMVVVLRKL